MAVRLRGHHLLCMLTYRGEGYSDAFVANFDETVRRISQGEPVEVIEGPDDICACLLKEKADAHCLNESVRTRDALALREIAGEGFDIKGAIRLNAARLANLREAFAKNRIRAACEGCEWAGLCTDIAKSGFKGVSLKL